jgi:hypothetical protein
MTDLVFQEIQRAAATVVKNYRQHVLAGKYDWAEACRRVVRRPLYKGNLHDAHAPEVLAAVEEKLRRLDRKAAAPLEDAAQGRKTEHLPPSGRRVKHSGKPDS